MSEKVTIKVTVTLTSSRDKYKSLELEDRVTYDEWDLHGLNRILRRINAAMSAERKKAARS